MNDFLGLQNSFSPKKGNLIKNIRAVFVYSTGKGHPSS
jgi:hypothetical protein